jgi:hypothetical protein
MGPHKFAQEKPFFLPLTRKSDWYFIHLYVYTNGILNEYTLQVLLMGANHITVMCQFRSECEKSYRSVRADRIFNYQVYCTLTVHYILKKKTRYSTQCSAYDLFPWGPFIKYYYLYCTRVKISGI